MSDRLGAAVNSPPMSSQSTLISEHRLARFVAWLGGFLLWLATGAPRTTRAHQRRHQRYRHIGAGALVRAVRDLVIIRAAQLMPEAPPSTRPRHDFAPAGFTARVAVPATLRAIAGVWLRRRLKIRGSFAEQVAHLIEALKHIRGLGAWLAWRRRRRLTRLRPIVLVRPPRARMSSLTQDVPAAQDSS
jgi:hypothetical protein